MIRGQAASREAGIRPEPTVQEGCQGLALGCRQGGQSRSGSRETQLRAETRAGGRTGLESGRLVTGRKAGKGSEEAGGSAAGGGARERPGPQAQGEPGRRPALSVVLKRGPAGARPRPTGSSPGKGRA